MAVHLFIAVRSLLDPTYNSSPPSDPVVVQKDAISDRVQLHDTCPKSRRWPIGPGPVSFFTARHTFNACIERYMLWRRVRPSKGRVVVSVSVSRRINVSSRSRLDENCQRLGLVSVSAISVSCPRPIFRQILWVTIIKLIKSVVAVSKSLAELV